MCDQTFRAAGGKLQGTLRPWHNHARVQDNIVQHARMHGVVGYTPRRNLDKMRLDWVRSPGEASEVMADASASRHRYTTTCCSCTECGVYQALSAFRWTKGRSRICGSCELVPCKACAAMLSHGHFARWDILRYFNSDCAKHITCLVCKEKRRHTRQRQKCSQRRCTKCGVYQELSTFRRTKKRGGRVDVCGGCELVPCEACAAMLPRGNYAKRDIYSYFDSARAKHVTCLVCKERRQHARKKRLQELMKKSKRRFCTCKHPQAHTRTCLLRVRFA